MHSRQILGRAHGLFSSARRVRILFAVATALTQPVFSGSARATSYDWGTGSSDYWENSALWSPSGIPGSGDAASVSNGEVTVDQQTSIDDLTLSSSFAVVNIDGNGSYGDAELAVANSITSTGTINLEAQDGVYFATLSIGGTLTNYGTINLSGADFGGGREIQGNVVNNYAIYDGGQTTALVGNVTNNNFYERQSGGITNIAAGYTFTQNANQLAIDSGGVFNVNGGVFNYAGGSVVGVVNLNQGYNPAIGTEYPHLQTSVADGQNATFNLYSTGVLDTDFSYNTNLNVIGNGTVGDVTLVVPEFSTNNGSITLEAQDGVYSSTLQIGDGSGTFTNNGTITLSSDDFGGNRQFTGNVANNYQIFDASQTTYLVGNVTNNSLYERTSGGTTNLQASDTFTQNAGQLSIDSGGVFNVNGGTFNYAGGAVVGVVNLNQGYDPAYGTEYPHLQTSVADGQNAVFNLYSNGYLDTDFSANTQLNVIGNGTVGNINLIVNDGATNNGTIELLAQDGVYQSGLAVYRASDGSYGGTYTIGHGGALVSTDPNLVGGARVVSGNLINYGNIGIQSPLDVFGSVDDRSGGTVAINEGESLTLHGADFTLDGGTLIIGPSAALSFTDGGSFQFIHGTLSVASALVIPNALKLGLGDSITAVGAGAKIDIPGGVIGGNLIAQDGGSVIGVNGAAIVASGAGNVIGVNGAAITATGPASLIGANAADLIANDGGSLIANDGGSITAQDANDSGGFVTASMLRPSSSLPPISAANIVADGGSITLNAGYATAAGDGIIENGGLLTGNGTFIATAFDVDATSTVVATGGTLHLVGAINPDVAGTLTTGYWLVEVNSTLDTPDIGDITVNQASITLDGVGSVWTNINNLMNNQGSLTITHGRNFLASAAFSNSGTLTVGPESTFEASAPLTNTGTIDVAGGTVQLDQGLAAGTIIAQLRLGFANGAWNGVGITSSLAATHPGTAVGYTLAGSSATLRYTWIGDTNLDGVVNGADLSNISPTGTTWATGDFNYDGHVNADDYALFMLGSTYGSVNISTTLPEPAGLLMVCGGLWAALLPRRRSWR